MKYIRQLAIILAVTLAAELIRYLVPLPIPAGIYGLVLLFLLLAAHILPLEAVKDTAGFLVSVMPLMFIPPAVGLLKSWDVLRPILLPVCVITLSVNVLVFAVTGKTAQALLRRRREGGTRRG